MATKAKSKTKTKTTKMEKPSKASSEEFYSGKRLRNSIRPGGGGGYWRPKDSESVIRPVLFQHENEPMLGMLNIQHWLKQVKDEGLPQVITCPQTFAWDADCAICSLEEEVPSKMWSKIRPQKKYLMNVIIRGEEDVFRVAELPATVFYEIMAYVEGRDAKGERPAVKAIPDILHPNKGRDFKILRSGESFTDTKYDVKPMQKASPWGLKKVEPVDLASLLKEAPGEEDLEQFATLIGER